MSCPRSCLAAVPDVWLPELQFLLGPEDQAAAQASSGPSLTSKPRPETRGEAAAAMAGLIAQITAAARKGDSHSLIS